MAFIYKNLICLIWKKDRISLDCSFKFFDLDPYTDFRVKEHIIFRNDVKTASLCRTFFAQTNCIVKIDEAWL